MEKKPCPPSCVDCAVAACRRGQEERYPEFCLTKNLDPEILAEAQALGAEIAARYDIKITYRDERCSTMAATRILLDGDLSRKKRKKVIDKMAAVFVLQGYLDYLQNNK